MPMTSCNRYKKGCRRCFLVSVDEDGFNLNKCHQNVPWVDKTWCLLRGAEDVVVRSHGCNSHGDNQGNCGWIP